jgi:hypothetical protein
MNATALVSDDSSLSVKSGRRPAEKPAPQPADHAETSVYAAYWQERSGFFSAESELPHRPSTR